MIDIHCHLLYGVDDGAKTIEESIAMLKHAASEGVEQIILTPHYRHGMFAYDREKIEEHYRCLLEASKDIGIKLYLGTEYHVNSQILSSFTEGKCHTLADGKYILMEYAYHSEYSYMKQMTDEVLRRGYIPVIAHVERYECLVDNPSLVEELQERGAWIQVNADAVIGEEGRGAKKFCKRLLKKEWVDVIASDSHGIKERVSNMKRCYDYISKKYDDEYAWILMQENPQEIIGEK